MKILSIPIILVAWIFFQQKQKTEVLFGKRYTVKIVSEVISDNDVELFYKSYSLYGKQQFGILIKGVKNDSVVVTSKTIILKDRIFCKEFYDRELFHQDSIYRVFIFKNGTNFKTLVSGFLNGKEFKYTLYQD